MARLITYRKYRSIEEAQETAAALDQAGLTYRLIDNSPPVDITFAQNTYLNAVHLKVLDHDIDQADQLLTELERVSIEEISDDHYIFDFTDEELLELLRKPDEWSFTDQQLAEQLLAQRGMNLPEEKLEEMRRDRLDALARPEPISWWVVHVGYMLALAGGFGGLVIGWYLWNSKKTLPNGSTVYYAGEHDRDHGKYIFCTGLAVFLGTSAWAVKNFLS